MVMCMKKMGIEEKKEEFSFHQDLKCYLVTYRYDDGIVTSESRKYLIYTGGNFYVVVIASNEEAVINIMRRTSYVRHYEDDKRVEFPVIKEIREMEHYMDLPDEVKERGDLDCLYISVYGCLYQRKYFKWKTIQDLFNIKRTVITYIGSFDPDSITAYGVEEMLTAEMINAQTYEKSQFVQPNMILSDNFTDLIPYNDYTYNLIIVSSYVDLYSLTILKEKLNSMSDAYRYDVYGLYNGSVYIQLRNNFCRMILAGSGHMEYVANVSTKPIHRVNVLKGEFHNEAYIKD